MFKSFVSFALDAATDNADVFADAPVEVATESAPGLLGNAVEFATDNAGLIAAGVGVLGAAGAGAYFWSRRDKKEEPAQKGATETPAPPEAPKTNPDATPAEEAEALLRDAIRRAQELLKEHGDDQKGSQAKQ